MAFASVRLIHFQFNRDGRERQTKLPGQGIAPVELSIRSQPAMFRSIQKAPIINSIQRKAHLRKRMRRAIFSGKAGSGDEFAGEIFGEQGGGLIAGGGLSERPHELCDGGFDRHLAEADDPVVLNALARFVD